eukprot:TRINITY_DN4711_c1_g1_i1.p1 TRINITY_DN4711_c1_g1~~TRINITY_DN4711_c1_g1_i1.p1  ORF type:complete len:419 (+),score=60.73 TRINITY_DN4711_c1_g1_i1:66-1259(+)
MPRLRWGACAAAALVLPAAGAPPLCTAPFVRWKYRCPDGYGHVPRDGDGSGSRRCEQAAAWLGMPEAFGAAVHPPAGQPGLGCFARGGSLYFAPPEGPGGADVEPGADTLLVCEAAVGRGAVSLADGPPDDDLYTPLARDPSLAPSFAPTTKLTQGTTPSSPPDCTPACPACAESILPVIIAGATLCYVALILPFPIAWVVRAVLRSYAGPAPAGGKGASSGRRGYLQYFEEGAATAERSQPPQPQPQPHSALPHPQQQQQGAARRSPPRSGRGSPSSPDELSTLQHSSPAARSASPVGRQSVAEAAQLNGLDALGPRQQTDRSSSRRHTIGSPATAASAATPGRPPSPGHQRHGSAAPTEPALRIPPRPSASAAAPASAGRAQARAAAAAGRGSRQ